MNISVGGVIDIQTAITIKTASSCGSEINMHNIIVQSIWSDCNKAFYRDMTSQICPLTVE